MLSLVQRSKDSILPFSYTANERRGKMFHQFLLSLEIKKAKRWCRMHCRSKKFAIFAGRTITDGVGQKMI
jgi:hypothetical protein